MGTSTRLFHKGRRPFLTPRSKRLRKGLSACVCASQALQSTHRRMSLPSHSVCSCTPKTMPSLLLSHLPGISQPLKMGISRNWVFPLYFGKNETQGSKMTSADTSGDSNHSQTAWLTVLPLPIPCRPRTSFSKDDHAQHMQQASLLQRLPEARSRPKLLGTLIRQDGTSQPTPHAVLSRESTHTCPRDKGT